MSSLIRRAAQAAALALALGLGGPCAVAGTDSSPASADLLDQPARPSVRAASALLLGVARAGQRLVAVGERGIVLISDDDARHWRQAADVPVSVALTNVRFVSAEHGWAVGHGGVVLHSADGGETWVKQLDGRRAAALARQAAQRALAQGDEGARRRLAEAERLVQDGPDKPFLDVLFLDARRGMVVGAYGLAFVTADGGASWEPIMNRIGDPRGRHLYSLAAFGETLVVAGEQGALYRSEDAGAHFTALPSPYPGTWFGAVLGRGGSLLAFGLRGHLYRSVDGGGAWAAVDSGQPVSFTAGTRLADGTIVVADEAGRILRSDDDGGTFHALAVPRPARFTGIAQGADGALVLSSVRGPVRLAASDLNKGATP